MDILLSTDERSERKTIDVIESWVSTRVKMLYGVASLGKGPSPRQLAIISAGLKKLVPEKSNTPNGAPQHRE